jgi:hypothetical protein
MRARACWREAQSEEREIAASQTLALPLFISAPARALRVTTLHGCVAQRCADAWLPVITSMVVVCSTVLR